MAKFWQLDVMLGKSTGYTPQSNARILILMSVKNTLIQRIVFRKWSVNVLKKRQWNIVNYRKQCKQISKMVAYNGQKEKNSMSDKRKCVYASFLKQKWKGSFIVAPG